jgi:hypothetical protein
MMMMMMMMIQTGTRDLWRRRDTSGDDVGIRRP